MKLRFLKHPITGKPDALLTMSCAVVGVCAAKFMMEGVVLELFGHSLSLGHADAMSYAAMLTPILGAHGASEYKRVKPNNEGSSQVDNPDV